MEETKLEKVAIFGKEFDKYLIVVFVIALLSFAIQAHFVSQIKFIGTSDPAHYAEAAENVIKGKGFSLDYINEYFLKFREISHPEEYTFPGISIILIPFIVLLGKTAFAIKLPSMIIGIILFPILIYYLGKDFFNKKIGFLSALTFLFYPQIFSMSFGGERDIVFAFFVVSSLYFFYKGVKEGNEFSFLIMGALLGFSYLIRQAGIVLIPVIFLAYYLINKRLSSKLFYGLAVAGLFVAPWLIRSYLIFGDPFFTVNKYAGWILGYAPLFEQQYFKLYWGMAKPGLFTMVSDLGVKAVALLYTFRFSTSLFGQATSTLIMNLFAFAGVIFASKKEISKKVSRWLIFLTALMIAAVFFNNFLMLPIKYNLLYHRALISIPYIAILVALFLLFRRDSIENTIFLMFLAFYTFFFTAIWTGGIRYFVALVPFLLIYSWFALEKILQKVGEKIINPPPTPEQIGKVLLVILAIFVLFSLPQTYGKFFDKDSDFPFHDDKNSVQRMRTAEKVKNITTENDVIMGCDVGVMHFYSDRKFLEFPSGGNMEISYIMKEYNVSYFILVGCERRSIDLGFFMSVFSGNMLLRDANYGPNAAKFSLPAGYKDIVFKVNLTSETVVNETALNMAVTPL